MSCFQKGKIMNYFQKGKFKESLKSIRYSILQAHACDKMLLPLLLLVMVLEAAAPFIIVVFPKFIIDEITIGKNLQRALGWVVLFFVTTLVIESAEAIINGIVDCKKEKLIQRQYKIFGNKIMGMDLEDLENPEIADRKERAQKVITWNSKNIDGIKNALGGMVAFLIQLIGFSYILWRLNIFIAVLLVCIIIINSILDKKRKKSSRKLDVELTPINRRWKYLKKITADYSYGKMIRTYQLLPMLLKKASANRGIYREKKQKLQKQDMAFKIAALFMSVLQEGIVYLFLVPAVLHEEITFGDLTMYLSATLAFTGAIQNFIGYTMGLGYTSEYVNDFIDFVHLPDSMPKEGKQKINANSCFFEFKNVSYKYPFSEKMVLQDINVTFTCGERLMLIGENGAGKSTFVKLLLRLYDPTSGEILLNGVNIKEYDLAEYYGLFSVIFQDFQLFAFRIKENITCASAYHEEEVIKTVKDVGLYHKLTSLPAGLHTFLGKSYEEEGIELSGGELQKLAIARALYKNGEVFIMDEPTSNLSPLSEFDIFKRFDSLTKKKSVFFVSHRLTGTSLCERILVFDGGKIQEDGSHQELMAINGIYKKMFEMQAQYYSTQEEIGL